ncbi:SIR2 family protein [Listeria innocua]|nr:SIR2 family protein [Listeria innocua]EKD7152042.1 SIR2 family protein [Listeria innocua]EKK7208455.1 SIR2 family protein [Listeria innocua]HBN5051444.1 SIR2 family protein [Listeria innocua]
MDGCVERDEFDKIIESVKAKYLSKPHLPKLIIGSGSSITFGYPSMTSLSEELHKSLKENEDFKKIYPEIKSKGLEHGLQSLNSEDGLIIDIRRVTAQFILQHEITQEENIYNSNCGLKKLIKYLSDSVEVNRPIVDIMTPNYDRVIEFICDSLGITVINGFLGGSTGIFNADLLEKPQDFYKMKRPPNKYVRLFKPHGSINWSNRDGKVLQVHDNKRLLEEIERIEIITPGGSKYEQGYNNIQYLRHREGFSQILKEDQNASLLFFGYGFNDKHFDVVTDTYFSKNNILIISKSVRKEIIEKAFSFANITVIYSNENEGNVIINNKKKYITYENLWDIEVFAEIFL